MMKRAMLIGVACVLGLATSVAHADILVNETFTHPDGNLVGQTPTPGPGGTWVAHSAEGNNPVQVSGGAAILNQTGTSSEDVNTGLGTVMGAGEKFYAAFDLINTGGSSTVYFAHFKTSGTYYLARAFITAPTGGGDYTIGLSNTSTMEVSWASDLTFGTSYRVVTSYDYDTGVSELWIDPLNESSTKILTSTGYSDPVEQYALRQGGSGSSQTIDDLVVATTFNEALTGVPEPASLLLLGLGALLARRR